MHISLYAGIAIIIRPQNPDTLQLSTKKIAEIVAGLLEGPNDILVSGLIIDSRKITLIGPDSLFVALSGVNNNGHIFIPQLYKSGIRVFLIQNNGFDYSSGDFRDAAFIIVEDTLKALQSLAAYKRECFEGEVIAITGSNGKTIVKEWLADSLSGYKNVIRSPRSYNSQSGVPLSVWNLSSDFDMAIFEAGMSMPGEIALLEKIIKPEIGVITNIGEPHQENFPDIRSKIREKLALFLNCSTIIYSLDQQELVDEITKSGILKGKRGVSWSFTNIEADYYFTHNLVELGRSTLALVSKTGSFSIEIPFTDKASILNSANVITVLLEIGLAVDIISDEFRSKRHISMRMEQKEGINSCTIIEDYYNSDLTALALALDFLEQTNGGKKRVVISDFVQQKSDNGVAYIELAGMLKRINSCSVICVGEELGAMKEYFNSDTLFFSTTDELLTWFKPQYFRNETILLKGARKFMFEKVSALLVLKAHITTLEINLNNLLSNLNLYKKKLKPNTKIMAMVKAFAYGAGPEQISSWLIKNGIDFLTVAYNDEGVQLRKAGIGARIMVMNPDPDTLPAMISNDLEPEIYCLEQLELLLINLKKEGVLSYPVHLKVDTGMHRLGFSKDEISEIATLIKNENAIKLSSVFSHMAASEDPTMDQISIKQAEDLITITNLVEETVGYRVDKHILNSSGIIRFPEYQFNMVRIGIGLFGTGENDIDGALPVLSFLTSISQIKTVKAGQGVGYGLIDKANTDRDIAIIPVGYADGLDRRLGSSNGQVLVKSTRVSIIGKVCMDMCMIDVSGLDVKRGDKVEIFGQNIPISELASWCQTIPYEIITGISPRVKRIYLYD